MASKAALEPFLKEAVDAEGKVKKEVNEAREQAVEDARAKLLNVSIQLPPAVDVNHLMNHLATQMQELAIKQDAKLDLALVKRAGPCPGAA